MGRFFDDVEKEYMKQFEKQDVLGFHHADKIEAYHKLLQKAMKRDSVVTVEEIKAYYGEEAYAKELAYLKQWD